MSPVWDYFELNDVNSDEAATAFHFGRVKTGNVVQNVLKNAMT